VAETDPAWQQPRLGSQPLATFTEPLQLARLKEPPRAYFDWAIW
jgi:hypothetical protein